MKSLLLTARPAPTRWPGLVALTWLCSCALLLFVFSPGIYAKPETHGNAGSGGAMGYLTPEHNGNAQSPVNIISVNIEPRQHTLIPHYQPSGEHIANRGHTVEALYEPGSFMEFDGKIFDLKQIHFHTPAEHLVDGVTYPMEMHMVHTLREQPGRYLVIGVLFREGLSNTMLQNILDNVPDKPGAIIDRPDIKINAAELLEPVAGYFHYEGSLTTPPYSETVTWLLIKDVHQAAPAQIEKLHRIEGDNARHIQDIHARHIDGN